MSSGKKEDFLDISSSKYHKVTLQKQPGLDKGTRGGGVRDECPDHQIGYCYATWRKVADDQYTAQKKGGGVGKD